MIIRTIKNDDFNEVENVIREAFYNVYMPGCDEHLIVHKLKNDKCFVKDLSMVSLDEDKIIGAILYGLCKLENEEDEKEVLFFGPLGVLPSYQGLENGANLIFESLTKAKEKGYPFVLITGNPMYYTRFGFEPCSRYNIYLKGHNKNEEANFFMIRVFDKEKMKYYSGEVSFPSIYEVNKDELEEFEKNFPFKEKEVRDNHLR